MTYHYTGKSSCFVHCLVDGEYNSVDARTSDAVALEPPATRRTCFTKLIKAFTAFIQLTNRKHHQRWRWHRDIINCWADENDKKVGWGGVDTPSTVVTTRAPAVLKKHCKNAKFFLSQRSMKRLKFKVTSPEKKQGPAPPNPHPTPPL